MTILIRTITLTSLLLLASACVRTGVVEEPTASPEDAGRANFQLGLEYFKQNKLLLAHEKFKRSVDQDGSQAKSHAFLALISEQLDQKEDARKHYKLALKIDPNDPEVQNMFGAYLCREGNTQEAEQHFLNAADNRFYATPEAAYTNAGTCVLKQKDYGKALDYLDKALKLNPRYQLALWQMANLHFEEQRDLQASAFLQRLGQPKQLPPEALLLGYRIAKRSGSSISMQDYSSALKERFPDSTETTILLETERNGG